MNYIPADKLIAEIERRKMPFKKDIEDGVYPTYLCALMAFEDIIKSLQQESHEVDLEKEVTRFVSDDKILSRLVKYDDALLIARHFYELGLNARKEE